MGLCNIYLDGRAAAASVARTRLKRNTFSPTYGTTKVVPFPKTCANQSFSAECKADVKGRPFTAALKRCATQMRPESPTFSQSTRKAWATRGA